MSDAHSNQMLFLLGFIGLLLLAMIAVITLSQLKKKKPAPELPPAPESLPTEPAAAPEKEPVAARSPLSAPADAVPEARDEEPTLEKALKNTEENFFGRIRRAFSGSDRKAVLEEVEEVLYTSDLGPATVQKLLGVVEGQLSGREMADLETVKSALRAEMIRILEPVHPADQKNRGVAELLHRAPEGPTVLMVVGVNGAGKTTSIGKITAQLAANKYKVLVAAGDTFRAAAGGQLKTWTDRASGAAAGEGAVEIFWPENTKDPGAVAFDAVTRAKSQNFDFVILDTAGRLHTQAPLMEELKKVKRVMAKVIPEAPHDTWIVLDANSGQNALLQAREFHQALGLTGAVLTKMDGTAKGGVALGVVDQIGIPLRLVGIGEKIHHLKTFDYTEYVDSILGR